MNAASSAPAVSRRAVEFHGRWEDFLKIVAVNLLLTVVTVGIFRFWAKARERRYLWSHTQLIDDRLEWTGTGGEMFIGFLMAMGVLLGWMVVVLGGAALFGDLYLVIAMLAFYIFMLWAFGFAQFRALRYRLSRTYWRGIRGGSETNGVAYGWSALGNNLLAAVTAGILTPHAITQN